jgi:hypothetical protein
MQPVVWTLFARRATTQTRPISLFRTCLVAIIVSTNHHSAGSGKLYSMHTPLLYVGRNRHGGIWMLRSIAGPSALLGE